MRILLLVAALAVAALAVACSGSNEPSERILHLGGGDFTESEARTETRAFLMRPGAESFCQSLEGLSNEEIAEVMADIKEEAGTDIQEAVWEDRVIAAGILKEECERIY